MATRGGMVALTIVVIGACQAPPADPGQCGAGDLEVTIEMSGPASDGSRRGCRGRST